MKDVIMIDSQAFEALVEEICEIIRAKNDAPRDRWVTKEVCKQKLGISSDTTLQKLKNADLIRYTEVGPRIHLYDLDSIEDYLTKKASTHG